MTLDAMLRTIEHEERRYVLTLHSGGERFIVAGGPASLTAAPWDGEDRAEVVGYKTDPTDIARRASWWIDIPKRPAVLFAGIALADWCGRDDLFLTVGTCPECNGDPKSKECSTCDGTGEHECSDCDAAHDCGKCDGSGGGCDCEGRPVTIVPTPRYGILEGVPIDRVLLGRILTVLGDGPIRAWFNGPTGMVLLVSALARGVLMPLRYAPADAPTFEGQR